MRTYSYVLLKKNQKKYSKFHMCTKICMGGRELKNRKGGVKYYSIMLKRIASEKSFANTTVNI